MIEDRKRPFDSSETASGGPLKRLREHTAPANGVHEEDESPAFQDLETFRKEALFRRMLEAQRDLSRSDKKTRALQRQVETLEERTSTFSRAWLILLADLESLLSRFPAQREALTSALSALQSASDPVALGHAIQQANNTIREAVSASISGQESRNPNEQETLDRCHALIEEASALRQQVMDQRRALDAGQSELSEAVAKLRTTERQRDRILAPGVWAVEHPNEPRPEPPVATPTPAQAASTSATPANGTPKPDPVSKEGSPVPSAKVNALEQEVHDLSVLAKTRLDEISGLREELVVAKNELERVHLRLSEAQTPSRKQIESTSAYLEVCARAEQAEAEAQRVKSEKDIDRAENANLRSAHQSLERMLGQEQGRALEDAKQQLGSRDSDLTRLRGQRDELTAKINEYKARASVQASTTQELRALVAIKERKAHRFRGEVRRLHMILAAKAGDKESWSKIRDTPLSSAEEGLDVEGALRQAKDSLQVSFDALQARYDALAASMGAEQVDTARLSAQVQDLRRLLASATGEDISEDAAAEVWRKQQAQVQQLQAQADTVDLTLSELCAEIDSLSAADASADRETERTLTKRVIELGKLEDKVLRLTAEKAKADNKYFSAMRAKDAVEAEKLLLSRQLEKHKAAVNKFSEAEKAFSTQRVLDEVEVKAAREALDAHKAELGQLKIALVSAEAREANACQVLASTEERMAQLIRSGEGARNDALRAEERSQGLSHDLERARKAAAAPRHGSSGSGNAELEALKSLLICSTCKERYRAKVITKCMHTFCSECVDSRIQTRQRKCPHCGLAFAISDVQPLYLQ